jgi:hypothetical protein
VGKGKRSEGIHARPYHEPSCTEKDRCGAARSLGQGQGAAEEGGLIRSSI